MKCTPHLKLRTYDFLLSHMHATVLKINFKKNLSSTHFILRGKKKHTIFFMSQKRHRKEICVYEKKSEYVRYRERGTSNSWLRLVWTAQRIYKNREKKIYKFTYKHTNTNHLLYTWSSRMYIYENVHKFGTEKKYEEEISQ